MATGQRVFVTAGASGIGLGCARAFVRAGARVHVCDIDPAALEALAKSDPAITSSLCDVADRAQAADAVEAAVKVLGGLDVLVSNAGISGPTSPLESLAPADWDRVLAVNLTGAFNVIQPSIPHIKRSAAGVVLIMSSLAGKHGYANRSPYSASKWALVGLAKTLAMELGGFGVRVNAILPGGVEGERVQRILEGRAKTSGRTIEEERLAAMGNQSLKRFTTPEEIGAFAVFLASDAARSISGQALSMDNDSQSGA